MLLCDSFAIFENNIYKTRFQNLNEIRLYYPYKYPLQIFKITHSKFIEGFFNVRIWVEIRGCSALWKGFIGDKVRLDVHPKDELNLEAKQVDRGVFESFLPKSEITKMWEERYALSDLPFPEGLEKIKEIELSEVLGYL
jgi:hypothetical protein